jgi:manganese-dependent inorganic pyrophosphatase
MKALLITSYVNPDLDGIACSIAYGEFMQKNNRSVTVSIIGNPQEEAKYVFNRFGFPPLAVIENANDFDEVILVDTSETHMLDNKIAVEKVVEIIDHRQVHEADKFPNAVSQIELVGAASTLVTEKFIQNGVEISKQSATLLYCAIISNTLNFRASVTTHRDKEAAKWLNRTANLPADFWKELFLAKSDLSGNKLVERIEGDFALLDIGGKKIGVAQIEMIGVKKLLDDRGDEVVGALQAIQNKQGLDMVFQNTIELEEPKNYIIAYEPETKQLLEKILDIKFEGAVAERPNIIMRKQITPLLKGELESNRVH